MAGITVEVFYNDKKEKLKLELIAGAKGLGRFISTSEINRIGLALTGFLDCFAKERIQILGLGEHLFLKQMAAPERLEALKKIFFLKEIPAVIISGTFEPLRELIQVCDQAGLPLFETSVEPSRVVGEVVFYLEENLSQKIIRHGSLVNVYGYGVLIEGDSGVGKSECAMGLIRRGHRFVADDKVEIRRHSEGSLVGRSDKLLQNYMEVRGLGIIDVVSIFGISSVLEKTNIDLAVRFEEWSPEKKYDRHGLDTVSAEILNIQIPLLILPVKPGRDLPILVEVAVLNQHLKNRGVNSAQVLQEKLIKSLKPK